MGRKKIDTNCKLPEGKINSTFMKRKQGAVNKAMQLGKLCDVDVAFIAFYPRNDSVIVVSHGGRIDEIINKFHNFKEQHYEKVQFFEQLREQPHQVQQHQMHPNIQVPHLSPPTFAMERGMPIDQLQGFDIHAQGDNYSPNHQLQGFNIHAQGDNGRPNNQQQLPQNQFLPPTLPSLDFQHNNHGQ